jgi:ATP-dependent Lon protease
VLFKNLPIQEVIRIPGYTFEEKLHISRNYLLPKQISAHGLEESQVQIKDSVLFKIAMGYTREAGVRGLEREIASICRALAVEHAELLEESGSSSGDATKRIDGNVTIERVESILGPERFEDEMAERTSAPGVVTGLAWTASGAGGLLFIEATQMPGKGSLVLTGKLGDVIKESAQLGLTWVRANAEHLGILNQGGNFLEKIDVHIHFPAGATPKDGPRYLILIYHSIFKLAL